MPKKVKHLLAAVLVAAFCFSATALEIAEIYNQPGTSRTIDNLTVQARPVPGYEAVARGKAVNNGTFYRGSEGKRVNLFPLVDQFMVIFDNPGLKSTEALSRIRGVLDEEDASRVELRGKDVNVAFYSIAGDVQFPGFQRMLMAISKTAVVQRVSHVYINEETGTEVSLSGKLVVSIRSPKDKELLLNI